MSLPGIPQHVIQRGNNRQFCFFADNDYLGKTAKERQLAYRALFPEQIPLQLLTDIRDAINKARVLGDDGFKKQIEKQTRRRASPEPRGGDRKSKQYIQNKNQ